MYSCIHWLIPRNFPLPNIWAHNTRALLVSQDRRHFFITPCFPRCESFYVESFTILLVIQRVLNELWRTRLACGRMIRVAHPLSPSPVSNLFLFLNLPVCRRSSLLTWGGGRGGRGAKSDDHETAYPSMNHSRLSDVNLPHCALRSSHAILFSDSSQF